MFLFPLFIFARGTPIISFEDDYSHNQQPRSVLIEDTVSFKHLATQCEHAESPVWDPDTSTLHWVDVLRQEIHSYEYYTGAHSVKTVGYGEVNIVMPIENSKRLLVAVRSQLFILDKSKPGDSGLRLVASLDEGKPDHILNEGKADALGRFWGGTKGPQSGHFVIPDRGSFYCIEGPQYRPRVALRPVSISNGLTWSLNNSVLYYIDSSTKKISAYDYVLKTGEIGNHRMIVDISKHGAHSAAIPDGMTIDRQGMLWVAINFEGMVIRIDPDSRTIIEAYRLPISQTTSVTWAGENLEDLVVVSSRRNMDANKLQSEPHAGNIFILQNLGTGGVPDYKFVFEDADNY